MYESVGVHNMQKMNCNHMTSKKLYEAVEDINEAYIKETSIGGIVVSRIIWAVVIIVAAGNLIGSFRVNFQSYISQWGPFTPCLVLLSMLTIASGFISLFLLWKAKHILTQGSHLSKPSAVQHLLLRLPRLLVILLMALALVDIAIRLSYLPQEKFLDPATLSFPQPSLVELENASDLVLDDLNSAYRFHAEKGTYAYTAPTFWSPVHIALCWSGVAKTTWWKDLIPDYSANMRYSPSINVDLWETRGRLPARLLYDDLSIRHYDWESHQILALDYVEQADWFISGANNTQLLIMRQGNRIAAIQYHGAASMDSLLPTIQRMITADWK